MALVFEIGGSFFSWGNRTLCNLNVSSNRITDVGAKEFCDALQEQEVAGDVLMDGNTGLIKISLQV